MRIAFVELQQFRKLRSVRIDLDQKTTLLIGANNSGKTSAMVALGHFLVDPSRFTTNDFTLSNWTTINKIGSDWSADTATPSAPPPSLASWEAVLPALDVWLEVPRSQIHHVRDLIPVLSWNDSLLGVRLRFQPKDIGALHKEYLSARHAAQQITTAAAVGGKPTTFSLWPKDLRSFLDRDRKLQSAFSVCAYLLDPTKCERPQNGIAKIQSLPSSSEPIKRDVLDGLIRIDEIGAQRGLGDPTGRAIKEDASDGPATRDRRRLSEQLRAYYTHHIDPARSPNAADLDALQAIDDAQRAFDDRLKAGFSTAIEELEALSYPGVTDPKLTIATKIRPTDGLNHNGAVQYEVTAADGKTATESLTLPEDYNGLGYQNLISMVFMLMSFRDAWMRVGKAGNLVDVAGGPRFFPPCLHLVLVEEPEAHLHCQVQQVFVRKAYEVLRNHANLKSSELHTQLIVSTHSSHVAHECSFSALRYFRRLPASTPNGVPVSAVINLSEVFGGNDETARFVTRYLRAAHCDLFFADAAIFVEGAAERMLVPHFIEQHFKKLNRCYVTLMEIGGSHAHRFRPLIEKLGLTTLIITDLDSCSSAGKHPAEAPKRNSDQISGNDTLKKWHPGIPMLDQLLDLQADKKVKDNKDVPLFAVRVAYQIPRMVTHGGATGEALATTFEDALVLENLSLFKTIAGEGMITKFNEAVNTTTDLANLSEAMFTILKKDSKAAFALDLLWLEDPGNLQIPTYIAEGLKWLEERLTGKAESVSTTPASTGPCVQLDGVGGSNG